MHGRTGRLLAGLLIAATALAPAAAAAAAGSTVDSPPPLATLTVGRLILEPTDRGYVGTLPATVTWNGSEPGWLNVSITEPVAGAWQGMANGEGCVYSDVTKMRRTNGCIISAIAPGETVDVTSKFHVFTTTRAYAMTVASAEIWLHQGDVRIGKAKTYSTTFRGTDGSLSRPQRYAQDKLSDATVTVGGPVTMVRQPEGWFLGRLPVTVQWNGDAPHQYVNIDVPSAAFDWLAWDTDPRSERPCAGGCAVPGPPAIYGLPVFMPGESASFDLIVYAADGTAPGSYQLTAAIGAVWVDGFLGDVSPADNEATFTAVIS